MDGGDGFKPTLDDRPDSPCSFEELERPPLRHIDKYVKAQCPCLNTIRYTVALMACLGFIVSFGMRCNMGMAKLQFENKVRDSFKRCSNNNNKITFLNNRNMKNYSTVMILTIKKMKSF